MKILVNTKEENLPKSEQQTLQRKERINLGKQKAETGSKRDPEEIMNGAKTEPETQNI